MIVADTSLLSYLVIDGARTPAARAVYDRDPIWVMPSLWRSEFLSVLAVSVRAGLFSERKARRAWKTALSLAYGAEHEPDSLAVLHLAVSKDISAYDAQFVVLAQMLSTVLVTADRKLVRCCPDYAVLIDHYAAGAAG